MAEMNKQRMTKILARAGSVEVAALSEDIQRLHKPVVVKEPQKSLTMIKLREPVQQSLFYLGEVIVHEAIVEIDGTQGAAVLMCSGSESDAAKVLDMAIIDAAVNKNIFSGFEVLADIEQQQDELVRKQNALHLKTMVSFDSLDQTAPSDLGAFKGGTK